MTRALSPSGYSASQLHQPVEITCEYDTIPRRNRSGSAEAGGKREKISLKGDWGVPFFCTDWKVQKVFSKR